MEWQPLIIEAISSSAVCIGALSWPVAVLILALVLKGPLFKLFPDVRKVKYGKVEFEFADRVLKLEEKITEADLPAEDLDATTSSIDRLYELDRLVSVSPRAAIIEAWLRVESALVQTALKADLEVTDKARAYQLMIELRRSKKISSDLFGLTNELRRLRNYAVHEADFSPRDDEVREYVDLSFRIMAALNYPPPDVQEENLLE